MNQWSTCRDNIEDQYYKLKADEDFKDIALKIFQAAFRDDETIQNIKTDNISSAIETKHKKQNQYKPYEEQVKITDCVAPYAIAYQMLDKSVEVVQINKEEVKTHLSNMFNNIKQKGEALHAVYLKYLSETGNNLESLRTEHQEFIEKFLSDASKKPQNSGLLSKLFGVKSGLSQIANNMNYLIMFKALVGKSGGPIVDHEQIKASVTLLLDDYISTSWFVSSHKKAKIVELKKAIDSSTTIEDIISILSQSKVDVFKADIALDETRWFKFRRVNYFGNSRFQNTIDSALNLTSALTGNELKELPTTLLHAISDSIPAHNTEDNMCFDKLSVLSSAPLSGDTSPTIGIIIKNIKAFSKNLCAAIEGMQGRDLKEPLNSLK